MLDQIKGKHLLIDGDIVLKTNPWQGSNGYWYHGNDELVHRFVVETILNIKLTRDLHVHHKDHNTSNNRFENLQIVTASEHPTIHAREDCIVAGFNPDLVLWCSNCKTYENIELFPKNRNHPRGYAQSCRRSFNELRIAKGWNFHKWNERAKVLQQIRRAKARTKSAELGRSP